jgi:hypothetical protein
MTGILILFLVVEFHDKPIPVNENLDFTRHRQVQEVIGGKPEGVVLVLPLDMKLNYLVPLTTYSHFHPLINGVSGHLPGPNGWIFDDLRKEHWDSTQADLLQSLQVRYLVIDSSKPGPDLLMDTGRFNRYLEDHGIRFELIETNTDHVRLHQLETTPVDDDLRIGFFHTLNPDRYPVEIYLWVKNHSRKMELPGDGRRLRISVRGYDATGRMIWREGINPLLQNFMPRNYTFGIHTPVPAGHASQPREIKIA